MGSASDCVDSTAERRTTPSPRIHGLWSPKRIILPGPSQRHPCCGTDCYPLACWILVLPPARLLFPHPIRRRRCFVCCSTHMGGSTGNRDGASDGTAEYVCPMIIGLIDGFVVGSTDGIRVGEVDGMESPSNPDTRNVIWAPDALMS
mmetsp:Transcript_33138/g.76368  ORF Transcript_33138/g.76368 Transcript_33138/m.76368 type:complete len:147 (-) Transcript_33138:1446-1886(-)